MSTAPSRQEQLDVTALLTCYDELASIAVLAASKGDTVVTLNNALAGKFKAGKQPGLSIIVEQPEEKPSEKFAGPLIETRTHTVTICELVMQNRLQDGTATTRAGMTRDEAKDHVKAALHYQCLGLALLIWAGTQPFNDGEGGQGYVVKFEIQGDTRQPQRSADPRITAAASFAIALIDFASYDGAGCSFYFDSTPFTVDPGDPSGAVPASLAPTGWNIYTQGTVAVLSCATAGAGHSVSVSAGNGVSLTSFTDGAEGAIITMLGGGAAGEVIRYTTDGSTPAPGSATAAVYSAPLTGLASGTLLRAASTATGRMISGITQFTTT